MSERYEVKSTKELMEKFGALQTSLKDAETHLFYLLSVASQAWQAEPKAHILDIHYTSSGITCDLWLPVDKKTYTVVITEKG